MSDFRTYEDVSIRSEETDDGKLRFSGYIAKFDDDSKELREHGLKFIERIKPGAFKNAVDSLGPEWAGKTVAFVSYGADGGVRATEHWRQIVANFQMVGVRGTVALFNFMEFEDGALVPFERREAEAGVMLDQLIAATAKNLVPAV